MKSHPLTQLLRLEGERNHGLPDGQRLKSRLARLLPYTCFQPVMCLFIQFYRRLESRHPVGAARDESTGIIELSNVVPHCRVCGLRAVMETRSPVAPAIAFPCLRVNHPVPPIAIRSYPGGVPIGVSWSMATSDYDFVPSTVPALLSVSGSGSLGIAESKACYHKQSSCCHK